MQLRTNALAILLAATKIVFSMGDEEVPELCYDYSDLHIDLDPQSCTSKKIVKKFKEIYKVKDGASDVNCKGGSKNEIKALTGNSDYDAALETLRDLCADALADAAVSIGEPEGWQLENVDMEEYFAGSGFLNEETGNFQQTTTKFLDNGGYDSYLVISEDPRLNDHYSTSEESYAAGLEVATLYSGRSKEKYLEAPTVDFEQCKSNTAMCCWGRDRQYFDGNGSCKPKDCVNENPGDNTDLCWTERGDNVFPYPGDNTEQDLHCHGISWGTDTSGRDINTLGKWNNLFYVSMYDHMYERGYVESITNDASIVGDVPMCGCIEDMAPVARADCQEVVGTSNYTVTVGDDDLFDVQPVAGTFQLDFESCEGYKFDEDLEPDDYEVELNLGELKESNNDLAGFVFKQWLERKLTDEQVAKVEKTLIGYRRSDLDLNDDNQRNEACEDAFKAKYPTLDYEEVEQTPPDTDSVDV